MFRVFEKVDDRDEITFFILNVLCHDLARDYLVIGHTDTHLGPIKHSNMLDSYHDLTRFNTRLYNYKICG